MAEGTYIGEVVYDGGGNFLVLYRDKETCVQVNKIFTRRLMEKTYTLKVLCTILEDPDFAGYRSDNRRLYEKHRINESRESVIYPVNSLPVVQVDPLTSRPLSVKRFVAGAEKDGKEKMSIERAAKYDKYRKEEHGDAAGDPFIPGSSLAGLYRLLLPEKKQRLILEQLKTRTRAREARFLYMTES